jgi:hypothetical protein
VKAAIFWSSMVYRKKPVSMTVGKLRYRRDRVHDRGPFEFELRYSRVLYRRIFGGGSPGALVASSACLFKWLPCTA